MAEALHELYLAAGRPGVRTIANRVTADDRFRDTVSYQKVSEMLRGASTPRWSKIEPVARLLAEWSIPPRDPDAEARRCKLLWDATQPDPSTSAPGQIIAVRTLTTGQHHTPPDAHHVVPQQLPERPWAFAGRTRELAWLDESLRSNGMSPTIVSIAGLGGVGKTWLALHWAHQQRNRFTDGQLYVNLRGFDPSGEPLNPEVAIRGFLNALGLDSGSLPCDAQELAALYRRALSHRRILILLDNARDGDQVKPLLPGGPHCTVVVTSRHHLVELVSAHGARPLTLDLLTAADAQQLLAGRLGHDRVEREPSAVDTLIDCCERLPLALSIVAAWATIHPTFELSAFAEELRSESNRLDILDGGELSTNLRAALSWSYRTLDEQTARVFRLLGMAPGPDIGVPAAAALTDLPIAKVARLLRALERGSMVSQHVPGRYRMHDLVRLHAVECSDAHSVDSSTAAITRLVSYHLHTAYLAERQLYPHRRDIKINVERTWHTSFADDAAALDWFNAEHACLLATQSAAAEHGWHQAVWQMAWTMHGYLWRRGHVRDQLATWRKGLAAAQEVGDASVQPLAHRLLGQACARAQLQAEAMDHLQRAIQLARQAGDRHGEARAYYDLAWALRSSEDPRALEHALHALGLFRDLGQPVWEAEALSAVGWYQARLGDLVTARKSCEQALALFTQNGNKQGRATTLDFLGFVAHQSGQHELALSYYRDSLSLRENLGATYDDADTLDHLGQAYAALGHLPEARAAWQDALDLNRGQHRQAEVTRIEEELAALDEIHL